MTYQFSPGPGRYLVVLKFAEIWFNSANQRVFNIAINGTTVQTSFDVLASAGGANKPVDIAFAVTTLGGVQITLNSVISNPKISAIEILPAPTDTYRIASGQASDFVDHAGRTWSADKYSLGGFSFSAQPPIAGGVVAAQDQPLFLHERFAIGTLKYRFPVSNGRYSVNLGFAEIFYHKQNQPGLREFAIVVNGSAVDPSFQPAVPGFPPDDPNVRPTSRSVAVDVASGLISIDLIPLVSSPKISFIEIVPLIGSPGVITPSRLEVNLSAVPIDLYMSLNNNGGGSPIVGGGRTPGASSCSTTITVRDCYQKMLATGPGNWRSQGVQGVRFFFTLAGGFYSTPFNSAGFLQSAWAANMRQFLKDLHDWGFTTVTPTPVFDNWSGPSGSHTDIAVSVCPANPQIKTLRFYPWLPYPLDPANEFPDRSCGLFGNLSYGETAMTPNNLFFWGRGWQAFFDVVNAVLGAAKDAPIQVNSFDYYQESNMEFTAQARMIYDPQRGTDVLGTLRQLMTNNGFDAGRIAPSANQVGFPFPATFNCGSWYGESALLWTVSQLSAAIAGFVPFGDPGDNDGSKGLSCLGPGILEEQIRIMTTLPVHHDQPTFIDMHNSRAYITSVADTATWAKNYHSSMRDYLVYRGRTSDSVVYGETNPVDPCGSEFSAAQAEVALNGLPGALNGYLNSTLRINNAAQVTFRPWQAATFGVCYSSPNQLNPPYKQ